MVQVARRDEREPVLRQGAGGAVDCVVFVQVVAQHVGHVARFLDLALVAEIVEDVGGVLTGLFDLRGRPFVFGRDVDNVVGDFDRTKNGAKRDCGEGQDMVR